MHIKHTPWAIPGAKQIILNFVLSPTLSVGDFQLGKHITGLWSPNRQAQVNTKEEMKKSFTGTPKFLWWTLQHGNSASMGPK